MNVKHRRRAAPKLTQKVDRGSQNRRAVEGKSNITTKRVTLLPGFLINGFTSNTVQKVKSTLDDVRKKKNLHLTDDLQTYLEQKGKYPRRSQRILKKHFQHHNNGSKTSSGNCPYDTVVPTPRNTTSQNVNNMPSNVSFKSILKNNSKSLFKDISDRFSKVNIRINEEVSQKTSVPIKESQNVNQNCDYLKGVGNCINQNPQFLNQDYQNSQLVDQNLQNLNQYGQNSNVNRQCSIQNEQYMDQNHFEEVLTPEPQDWFKIEVNRSFCRNLEKQISVTFKRNVIDECGKKLKTEMETVNLVLQGKGEIEGMIVHDDDDKQTELETSDDRPVMKFHPVLSQNWVYRTPPNQKIGMPRMDECQLQPGVLCQNKNQRNLYEVKPSFNVNFSKLKHIDNVPIDERFMKKVAEVKKTPANFGFRAYRSDGGQNVFQQPWTEPVGCGGSAELSREKDSFVKPNFVNIITRPVKMPRNPASVFSNYLDENLPTPKILQETENPNTDGLQDFTFIEDGNDFKMQDSQTAVEQRNKRKLDEEEFVIKRKNLFITAPMSCEKNMFNFGSQERNMFNFGKV